MKPLSPIIVLLCGGACHELEASSEPRSTSNRPCVRDSKTSKQTNWAFFLTNPKRPADGQNDGPSFRSLRLTRAPRLHVPSVQYRTSTYPDQRKDCYEQHREQGDERRRRVDIPGPPNVTVMAGDLDGVARDRLDQSG